MELTQEEVKMILECINAVNVPGAMVEKVVALKAKLNEELQKGVANENGAK